MWLRSFTPRARIIPSPLFDTQVAAMVCGFGDQVGYETLVKRIARAPLDKSSRFTDWSRRPLSEAQQNYALADVTHLRKIYEYLNKELEETGRSKWLKEELKVLQTPETYIVDPAQAWQRIKTRTTSGKFLALVRELAQFRESYAQENNVPRNRVYKDDALIELASLKPQNPKDLSRARLLLREGRKGPVMEGILAAIGRGLACKAEDYPKGDKVKEKQQGSPALSDLLRVLLKAKTEETGVAAKLIASAAELDQISAGERDMPALKGWRREVFGEDALRLCDGEIALGAKGGKIVITQTD
jgi:ribonuclease D